MNRITGLLLTFLLLMLPILAHSATIYESSTKRVSLLELYTSEGCSSCPPADRWLSDLKDDKRLWKEIVPVAFHVDYWNYIGWDDKFASPDYSKRQRQYARDKNVSTVYTPGFLLNGEEWRSFFGLRQLNTDSDKDVGQLIAKLDDKQIHAMFTPTVITKEPMQLNIAVLGFDLVTEVKAGENRGKALEHDFTVLGYNTVSLQPTGHGYEAAISLPKLNVPAAGKRMGIAVWVNRKNNLTPIQATGGWLEEAGS